MMSYRNSGKFPEKGDIVREYGISQIVIYRVLGIPFHQTILHLDCVCIKSMNLFIPVNNTLHRFAAHDLWLILNEEQIFMCQF